MESMDNVLASALKFYSTMSIGDVPSGGDYSDVFGGFYSGLGGGDVPDIFGGTDYDGYFATMLSVYAHLSELIPEEILTYTGTYGTKEWAKYYNQPWFTSYINYWTSVQPQLGIYGGSFTMGDGWLASLAAATSGLAEAEVTSETEETGAEETEETAEETGAEETGETAAEKTGEETGEETAETSETSASAASESETSSSDDSESSSSDAANNLYVPLGMVGLVALALL